jgi:hypothetical protein
VGLGSLNMCVEPFTARGTRQITISTKARFRKGTRTSRSKIPDRGRAGARADGPRLQEVHGSVRQRPSNQHRGVTVVMPLTSCWQSSRLVGCLIGRVTPCLETCLSCTVCRLTAVEAAPAGDMLGRPESVRAERRHPEIGRSLRARGGHSRRTENPIGMMRRSGVARAVMAA